MASGIGLGGGKGRCYGFFVDFRNCYQQLKKDALSKDSAIKNAEEQQAIKDRLETLQGRLEQRLDAEPGLRTRFEQLLNPVHDDPDYARAFARFDRAMHENHPETARGLVLEMNEIADAKPERQEAFKLVPEFKELKDMEKLLSSRPHPAQECINLREDYLECIHGTKFKAREMEIQRVANLKAKGEWPQKDFRLR